MMRRAVLTSVFAFLAGTAQAGSLFDAPVLRGSVDAPGVYRNWQGFYVGGQFGAGFSNMDFTGANESLTAQLLANTAIQNEFSVSRWPLLGKTSGYGQGFGGFFGYNRQWDDVVLSIEGSYIHGDFGGSASGTMSRLFTTSDGYSNTVSSTSTAEIKVRDMMTVRGRMAYVWGPFLPYAFGGVAIGFADVTRTSSVTAQGTYIGGAAPPPPNYGPVTVAAVDQAKNQFLNGYTAGFGADVRLFGGLFLRGEYEYARLMSFTPVSINTIRGGIGYKF